MKYPESQIQQAFIQWVRLSYKKHPALRLGFAVPNGGHRSIITASILKAEGVVAGIPDWCLPVPSNGYAGLFLEFKAGKSKPTPAQAEYIALLREYGHRVEVVNDAEVAIKIVIGYLESRQSRIPA